MHAADQVVALDPAVGEQRAAMRAAALEDVDLPAPANEHELDAVGRGMGRPVLPEIVEPGDRQVCAVHSTLPLDPTPG